MNDAWLIYGANGYTGRLVARLAKARGLDPMLGGRNAEEVGKIARELGLQSRVFDLGDADTVARNLNGVAAVLHCAGPFSATSKPMLDACLRARMHYLDITGEIAVFEAVFSREAEIRRAGIVAVPGVGFDVVPTDCLAAMLKRALPSATHLKLAFRSRFGRLSAGTVKTAIEGLPGGGRIRRDGKIIAVAPAYKVEAIPFTPDEATTAVTIPWGDISTAYRSTAIPNIEVFVGATPKQIARMRMPGFIQRLMGLSPVQAFLKAQAAKRLIGPDDEQRAADEMLLYGEARDNDGNKAALRLRTIEGYSFTAESGIAATLEVISSRLAPGAYTPSLAFGADFVLQFEGTRLTRVEDQA